MHFGINKGKQKHFTTHKDNDEDYKESKEDTDVDEKEEDIELKENNESGGSIRDDID